MSLALLERTIHRPEAPRQAHASHALPGPSVTHLVNQFAQLAQLERTIRQQEVPPLPRALHAQLDFPAVLAALSARFAHLAVTTHQAETSV